MLKRRVRRQHYRTHWLRWTRARGGRTNYSSSRPRRLRPGRAPTHPPRRAAASVDGVVLLLGRDDAGSSEDLPKGSSDAGWLGLPFTQEEDEEDWVGMVDWEALAASTGEPSSS